MRTILLALCLFVSCAASADIYSFSLLSAGGNLQGAPGSTIGWGYSIENQSSTLWLVTTGVNSDGFLNATPNLIFDFPVIGPGASATAGLLELTWNASAPIGFVNSGAFDLSAEWW